MRRLVLAGLVALAGSSTACVVEPTTEPSGAVKSPVYGGVDSPAARDGVVEVVATRPGAPAACSASLVAPNLVMLARHCVQEVRQPFVCQPDGTPYPDSQSTGYFLQTVPTELIEVWAAGGGSSFGPIANAQRVFVTSWSSICADDLAFVQLDRMLSFLPIYPLRLARQTRAGELVTVAGYGLSDRPGGARRQERSGIPIIGVGAPSGASPNEVRPRSFIIRGTVCFGDSGGPAFAEETGAIVGVFSTLAGPCGAASSPATYSLLAPHATFVREVFAKAGAQLWVEDEGASWLRRNGWPCTLGPECRSGRCSRDTGLCVAALCDGGACTPEGDGAVGGTSGDSGGSDQAISPVRSGQDVRRTSGCIAAPVARSESFASAVLTLAALACAARRGRRLS